MGKGSSARYYEDFKVGLRFECPAPRKVTDADRTAWIGFTGDPISRFADGSKHVHPLLVFAMAHGQVASEIHGHTREELGVSNLVVHRPVPVGALVRTTARVIGMREDPDHRCGVVWVRVAGRDARGVVLSYVTWFRVPKKHKQSAPPPDTLPTLVDQVPLTELYTRDVQSTPRHETGGRFVFEDYLVGESIHHRGAHRVVAGDPSRFARWFRQSDPRHHDPGHAHYAAPLPLVVGAGYAQAHDGLEDRLGLGAINALRTPHPVVDADTLFAMTTVTATQPISRELGAVRARLFVFKNHDPSNDRSPVITEGKRYHPHIALDMDYWELLPTRHGLRA